MFDKPTALLLLAKKEGRRKKIDLLAADLYQAVKIYLPRIPIVCTGSLIGCCFLPLLPEDFRISRICRKNGKKRALP